MSSILKFFRDLFCCCCCTKDPPDALFAAGVEVWKKYEKTGESQYLAEAVQKHQAALDIHLTIRQPCQTFVYWVIHISWNLFCILPWPFWHNAKVP